VTKAAPLPRLLVPAVVPAAPAAQAPGKFRREYRRWKGILIALRHRLLREGSHLEEEGLKALEQEVSVDHMADFGSDSSEQETTLQLIEVNSLSMRDVDDALKRIDARSYGLCEECEALIPPARLEVLPHARLCIACQSKREGMPS
jgi:RNA polymerase-binding transcription factor DksA